MRAVMTADEVIAARGALGMTRAEFAAALKATVRTVQAWEIGTRNIPGPAQVAIGFLLQQHRQHPRGVDPSPAAKAGAPRKRAAR
jgi:DNA-binding transcriptional regulator YiaG